MPSHLTERRKADRQKMTADILELVARLGISGEVRIAEGQMATSPRLSLIRLQDERGLAIYVEFDGESSQPDVYVLSWHMSAYVDKQLSDEFAGADAVNRFHRRKATQIALGFESFCQQLEKGFLKSRSGIAYLNAEGGK